MKLLNPLTMIQAVLALTVLCGSPSESRAITASEHEQLEAFYDRYGIGPDDILTTEEWALLRVEVGPVVADQVEQWVTIGHNRFQSRWWDMRGHAVTWTNDDHVTETSTQWTNDMHLYTESRRGHSTQSSRGWDPSHEASWSFSRPKHSTLVSENWRDRGHQFAVSREEHNLPAPPNNIAEMKLWSR